MSTYTQFGQVPFAYTNGLNISNNATTPNTVIDIAVGSVMDSTKTFQLTASSALTVSSASNGLNGLDTGTIAASTVYAVLLVADPVTDSATGAMISLSATAPTMPFGYSAFALLGYVVTDGSANFLKGLWKGGNSSRRTFMYDAPQATAITAGAATTYTAIDLSALVPAVTDQRLVYINSAFTPGAASRTLKLRPTGNTGDSIVITGQVASVVISNQSAIYARLSSAKPKIDYVVSNAGDAAAINVAGYDYFL